MDFLRLGRAELADLEVHEVPRIRPLDCLGLVQAVLRICPLDYLGLVQAGATGHFGMFPRDYWAQGSQALAWYSAC